MVTEPDPRKGPGNRTPPTDQLTTTSDNAEFGQVAASLRRAGRKPAAQAYDAVIAATAVANGLAVYTCNPADFEGIDVLEVFAIPHPGDR